MAGNFLRTIEYRKKMSRIMKGKIFSKRHRLNLSKSRKGIKFSEETKRKMSEAKKKNPVRYWKGKKALHLTGKNNWNWKGGYEKHLWHNRQRRIKKLNAIGNHSFGEWELLKKQYGYRCPACGKLEPIIKLTEDHIIPLSKGGADYIENIQPLCLSCNSRKQAKIIKYNNKEALQEMKDAGFNIDEIVMRIKK